MEGPRFKDFGGIGEAIEELKSKCLLPIFHPQLHDHLGLKNLTVKKCILLHGPPRCGKTRLAEAIANEAGVPLYKISVPELMSGVYGESEREIRELFQQAYSNAPSVVFIDEIEAIAYNNPEDDMKKRIVSQLVYSIKDSYVPVPGYVLVIGATNCPDSMDPELRGRFQVDDRIALGFPNEAARIEILSKLARKLKVEEGAIDLKKIARLTRGYVGGDLTAIALKAGNLAKKRIAGKKRDELSKEEKDEDHSEDWLKFPWSDEEVENLYVTMADFEEAAKMVQPSSRFSDIPNVKWDDVGGLHSLKEAFDHHILRRIKFREAYEAFGLDLATGFLLYGPPGCGKTLIAKAVANEAGANFIHIKGLELKTEWEVPTIFSRAKAGSPCIIFFEQVDALTTNRGREGGWVVGPSLTQLVKELDDSKHRNIHVICTTDRPEVMDADMFRRGGLWKPVYVPLPSPDERGMILEVHARNRPIDANLDLMSIAKHSGCDKFSGADLSSLMYEAAVLAQEDPLSSMDTSSSIQGTIKETHFMSALEKISPSVSDEDVKRCERYSKQ